MSESNRSLSECLRKIFNYEYDNAMFGMKRSEFTDDIIEIEVSRLLIDEDIRDKDFYAISLHQDNTDVMGCDTKEDLVDKLIDKMQDIYIVHAGNAYITDFDNSGIIMESVI